MPITVGTSNAEAHACMYNTPLAYLNDLRYTSGLVNTHPWTSIAAMFSDSGETLREFRQVKNKASDKRLNHIYDPQCQEAPHEHLFPTLYGLLHDGRPLESHPAKLPSGLRTRFSIANINNIFDSYQLFTKYFQKKLCGRQQRNGATRSEGI